MIIVHFTPAQFVAVLAMLTVAGSLAVKVASVLQLILKIPLTGEYIPGGRFNEQDWTAERHAPKRAVIALAD